MDGALEQVGQAFLVTAFGDFLGDVEIGRCQALEQVVGGQGRGGGGERQGQDRRIDVALENRQRLFGFLARIFEKLEAQVEILLVDDRRDDLRSQFGRYLVGG